MPPREVEVKVGAMCVWGVKLEPGGGVLLCLHGESLQAAVYRAPELGLGNFWAPMPGLHVRSVTV